MSGQRIDDHSCWCGSRGKDSVLPVGNKVKTYSSAEGAGAVGKYEDTTEAIKGMQEAGKGKVRKYPHNNDTRN